MRRIRKILIKPTQVTKTTLKKPRGRITKAPQVPKTRITINPPKPTKPVAIQKTPRVKPTNAIKVDPLINVQSQDLIKLIHKSIKEKTPLSITRFGDGAFHLLKNANDFSNDYAKSIHCISMNHILNRNGIFLCTEHEHSPIGGRIGVNLYNGGVPNCNCYLQDKDATDWINEMKRRIVIGINESSHVGLSVPSVSSVSKEYYTVNNTVLDRYGIKRDLNRIDSLFTNLHAFSALDSAKKLFQNQKIHIVSRNKTEFINQDISYKLGCELSFTDMSDERSYKLVDKIKQDIIDTDANIVLFSGGVYIKHLIPFAAGLGKVAIDTGSIVDAWCNIPSRGWYDKPDMSYTNWSNEKVIKVADMTTVKQNQHIDQIFFPDEFSHFNNKENQCSFLKPYYDVNQPSFFFSTRALDHILYTHKGIAIMIVNNSVLPLIEKIYEVKKKKGLYFISTSKLVSNYLKHLGLKYIEFPWGASVIPLNANANKKGNCVYFYGDAPNRNHYGYHIIKRIMKQNFPHLKLITACHPINQRANKNLPNGFPSFSEHALNEVYKKVFVGVRLTRFDGLAGSVQDLGIRGIKTIWNGGTPSALSYESEADIINHIKNEEMSIGSTDNSLASLCKNYLDLNNESYKYIFNINTYIGSKESPKLFFNDKELSVIPYRDWLSDIHNMNLPLSV